MTKELGKSVVEPALDLVRGDSDVADESLWRVCDVARHLCASISWVYKAAEREQLPCIRIGAMLRFEPAAIRSWLAGQRIRSA